MTPTRVHAFRRSAPMTLLLIALLPTAGWAIDGSPTTSSGLQPASASSIAWDSAEWNPLQIASGSTPRVPGGRLLENPLAIGLLALGMAVFGFAGSDGARPARLRRRRSAYLAPEGLVAG